MLACGTQDFAPSSPKAPAQAPGKSHGRGERPIHIAAASPPPKAPEAAIPPGARGEAPPVRPSSALMELVCNTLRVATREKTPHEPPLSVVTVQASSRCLARDAGERRGSMPGSAEPPRSLGQGVAVSPASSARPARPPSRSDAIVETRPASAPLRMRSLRRLAARASFRKMMRPQSAASPRSSSSPSAPRRAGASAATGAATGAAAGAAGAGVAPRCLPPPRERQRSPSPPAPEACESMTSSRLTPVPLEFQRRDHRILRAASSTLDSSPSSPSGLPSGSPSPRRAGRLATTRTNQRPPPRRRMRFITAPAVLAGPPARMNGLCFGDLQALVDQNRSWCSDSTSCPGKRTMHEAVLEIVIPATVCSERVLTLSAKDLSKLKARSEGGYFISDSDLTLDPALGETVNLGLVDVPTGLTLHGRLCRGGLVRQRYWALQNERDDEWQTTPATSRESTALYEVAPVPAELKTCPAALADEDPSIDGPVGEVENQLRSTADLLAGDTVVFRRGTSFVKACERGRSGVQADSFVSHSWGEAFVDFTKALQKHERALRGDAAPGSRAYYIDAFCNCHHRDGDIGLCWQDRRFRLALGHIAHRAQECTSTECDAVIVTDREATPLRRKWCLFEVWQCAEHGVPLSIFSSEGEVHRGSTSALARAIRRSVEDIDFSAAECSDPADSAMLLSAVEGSKGGLAGLHASMRSAIHNLLTYMGEFSITRDPATGRSLKEIDVRIRVVAPDLMKGMTLTTANVAASICGSLGVELAAASGRLRWLVVAPGGCGKAAFIRAVVRRVEEAARGKGPTYIPVYASLAKLAKLAADTEPTMDIFSTWVQGTSRSATIASLGAQPLLLLLDGFDEAGHARSRILSWLREFLQRDADTAVMMTTRPSGLDTEAVCSGVARAPQETQGLCVDPLTDRLGVQKVCFCPGSYVTLSNLKPPHCFVQDCSMGLSLIEHSQMPPGMVTYHEDTGKMELRNGIYQGLELKTITGGGARATVRVVIASRSVAEITVEKHGNGYAVGDRVVVVLTRCGKSRGASLSEDVFAVEWRLQDDDIDLKLDRGLKAQWRDVCLPPGAQILSLHRQASLRDVADGIYVDIGLLSTTGEGRGAWLTVVVASHTFLDVRALEAGHGYAKGDGVRVTIDGVSVDWQLQDGAVIHYLGLCRDAKDTRHATRRLSTIRALTNLVHRDAACRVREVVAREQLVQEFGFTDVTLEPISVKEARTICANAACNGKRMERFLRRLPPELWNSPRSASLLGQYLVATKEAEGSVMKASILELMVLRFIVESLVAEAARAASPGVLAETLLRQLSELCRNKLMSGDCVILRGEINAGVFDAACRGRLLLFEPVDGGRAVRFYQPNIPELLTAEEWARSVERIWLEKACIQAHKVLGLRKAFRFLIQIALAAQDDAEDLAMDFSRSRACINDAVPQQLASGALPAGLASLRLDFSGAVLLTDVGLGHLADALPPRLCKLRINFSGNDRFTDAGITRLAAALPKSLKSLHLDMPFNLNMTDTGLARLSAGFPSGLKGLHLDFFCNRNFTKAGLDLLAVALRDAFPMTWLRVWCDRCEKSAELLTRMDELP